MTDKKYSALIISLGSISSRWIADAMKKYFASVDHVDIRQVEVVLTPQGPKVFANGKQISGYDCVYAKGSFRYESLLRAISSVLIKESYMPLEPHSYTFANNKLYTYLELAKNNIPIPETYIAPNINSARKILENMRYPVIMKFPQGTQGKGVMFADSYAAASSMLDALTALRQPFIIQEYVDTDGTDIRLIVVGDDIAASMKRTAKQDEVRANYHAGGSCTPHEPDMKIRNIAIKAAKSINASICGVDILLGAKGSVVLEINASPGLQGITKATNIDIADKIAKYLYDSTSEHIKLKATNGHPQKMLDHIEEHEKKQETGQSIIQGIEMRGERILLPKIITQLTKFSNDDEVVINASKKSIKITKL